MKKAMIFVLVGMLLILGASCSVKQEAEITCKEDSLFAMNTYMTFTAYGEHAESALAAAKARIRELESFWSVTNKTSEIFLANHSGGKCVKISEETAEQFQLEDGRNETICVLE